MMEYAEHLGLFDSMVFFTGVKTEEELAGLLGGADFSVLSSRYETFGTVVIESLACGVPVVATSVGVAPAIINENNGLLVPPEDEAAMTAALNTMVDSCRTYDRQQVRSATEGKFDPESVGAQLLAVYRKVLDKKH